MADKRPVQVIAAAVAWVTRRGVTRQEIERGISKRMYIAARHGQLGKVPVSIICIPLGPAARQVHLDNPVTAIVEVKCFVCPRVNAGDNAIQCVVSIRPRLSPLHGLCDASLCIVVHGFIVNPCRQTHAGHPSKRVNDRYCLVSLRRR